MSLWRIQHYVVRWTWHVPVAAIQSEWHSCVGLTIRAVMFQDQSKRTFNSAYLPRVSLLMYQKWSFSMFVVIAITSSAMNHWPSPTMIMNRHYWVLTWASTEVHSIVQKSSHVHYAYYIGHTILQLRSVLRTVHWLTPPLSPSTLRQQGGAWAVGKPESSGLFIVFSA